MISVCVFLLIVNGIAMAQNLPNPIFDSTERLVYDVHWMGIRAGKITMTLQNQGNFRGNEAIKSEVIGETSSTFSRFFMVHDVLYSIFCKDNFYPLIFSKSIHEGKYHKNQAMDYDHIKGTATTPKKTFPITPGSKDPITAIYYLRSMHLDLGSEISMTANSEGKEYPVKIHVKNRETLETPIGYFKALVLTPMPTWEGRVFEKGRSEVKLWLSDDDYRVPLMIQMKVKIGSMKATLVGREGPGWEIPILVEEK
jgi:hypothetical protein